MTKIFFMLLFLSSFPVRSFAAVGCTLNDPDRDVLRLFPESTNYKTAFVTLKDLGPQASPQEIEKKLGDKLDSFYETPDVPYAYYTVLKGKGVIGRIHGVNQKGKYAGMQLILATDTQGKILSFYYQRLSSPEAKRFRDPTFTNQFIGLTLADFMEEGGRASRIADPSLGSSEDFKATLRGLKKNLILLDEFLRSQGGEK